MNSKMGIEPSSPLSRTLSNAAFREYHCAVIDSSVDNVWVELHDLRWLDLTAARPLLLARGFGIAGLMRAGCLEMFMLNGASEESAPRRFTVVMVGKPWSPVPASVPVSSLAECRQFSAPGWLKYGMDWTLTELGDDRTLVETTTQCEPTDRSARVKFSLYWALIRGFSGLVRRDMLGSIGRLARGKSRVPVV